MRFFGNPQRWNRAAKYPLFVGKLCRTPRARFPSTHTVVNVTSAAILVFWNKRNILHKNRGQFPEDWFTPPTWPQFLCFANVLKKVVSRHPYSSIQRCTEVSKVSAFQNLSPPQRWWLCWKTLYHLQPLNQLDLEGKFTELVLNISWSVDYKQLKKYLLWSYIDH